MKSFQFRLLHHAITTNMHTVHWGKVEAKLCSFCGKAKETYIHLFVQCEYIQVIWDEVKTICKKFKNCSFDFSIKNVLFSTICSKYLCIINYICIIAKQYIYKQRVCKELPVRHEFKKLIVQTQSMKKYYAVSNGKIASHNKKWQGNCSIL